MDDAAASSSMSSSPSAFPGNHWNATVGDSDHQDPLLVYPGVPYPDLTQLPGVCSAFVLLYIIVMVLALVGNSMVCYTVLSDRKMHTAVNYYMVNLAACDLAVGAFVLPGQADGTSRSGIVVTDDRLALHGAALLPDGRRLRVCVDARSRPCLER
ncbi:hypothetical protein MTO96_012377 [Rhipicephalus appendiculatus]